MAESNRRVNQYGQGPAPQITGGGLFAFALYRREET